MKQSVTVIEPRGDDTACDCLHHFVGQQTAHVMNGVSVIVTRSCYVGGVAFESEVRGNGDAERLDSV